MMSLLRRPSRRHRFRLSHVLPLFALIAASAGLPTWASGQTPAPAPPAGGWQNGFLLQSPDGQTRLQFGLLTQFDGRFAFEDDTSELTDAFLIRRVRPSLRGRIGGRFEFLLNPDFALGTLVVQDAYFDTRFSQAFRLRIGKAKSPFGHERLHSAAGMLFIERALPTGVAPNRDVGIQVLGDIAGGAVSYSAGVLNGSRDGGSADIDTNDGKELVGRVLVRPVTGLGLALSVSTGNQTGSLLLPAYRTTIFQQTFFSYAGTGAGADGRLTRYSPYASYYRKAFGGFTEFVRSELPVRSDDRRESVAHRAWQVAASWVLTGEDATDNGVVPRAEFNFGNGGWGAFQIAGRYQQLTVDDIAFDAGFATPGSNRNAEGWSAAVNWYFTRHLLARVHFERTVFDDNNGSRPAENVFAFRSQLNF
jgi:phosphate-selective porin OprO/OprP